MYFSRREGPTSSPKTHARVQLGWKVDRVAGRVVENLSAYVAFGQLMRCTKLCRANGSDREEFEACEACEGRCALCHP